MRTLDGVHWRGGRQRRRARALAGESGQAAVLLLGVAGVVLAGVLILAAFGQALGAKGRHQRAADLSAISAARAMQKSYPRLFEPAYLESGNANPNHLTHAGYLALARQAAVRAAARNGMPAGAADVQFPDAGSFAPVRVSVSVRGPARVRVSGGGEGAVRELTVRARATAELAVGASGAAYPDLAMGGGYTGPLAYRQGKPMRPDVAAAFDRMASAARREGIELVVTSGFRSDAEQARLFAANPNPRMVARPGHSLHRNGTELDLGPPSSYGWLARNARQFGFVQRYSWEPWHYGYTHNAGTASVGFGGSAGDGRSAIPSYVPARFRPTLARAAQRWNVSAGLLAAQIYAESNFNPFAVSPAGARGIAQFMPGTARAFGLDDPFDAAASIDAQARMMRDLLRRFSSVPLALAAYNAGPGAVAGCGCIPPFPETRAYVAKILGLLGGVGEIAGAGELGVHLVE